MFDYFYGGQAGLFSFYRIPKALFTDARIRGISAEAKILYGLLLDRMGLSVKNGWTDDTGRVYIIFTTEEIMEALYCADNKAAGRMIPAGYTSSSRQKKSWKRSTVRTTRPPSS